MPQCADCYPPSLWLVPCPGVGFWLCKPMVHYALFFCTLATILIDRGWIGSIPE